MKTTLSFTLVFLLLFTAFAVFTLPSTAETYIAVYGNGMENWVNSPNKGDYDAATQILFCPMPWDANYYQAGLEVTINMKAVDNSSNDTFTTTVATRYNGGTWGVLRVEPCLMDVPWVPVKDKHYIATFTFVDRYGATVIYTPAYDDGDPVEYFLDCEPIVPENGHTWVEVSRVSPTCTMVGSILYHCNDCGAEYTITIPALSHQIGSDGVCIICGETDFEPRIVVTGASGKPGESVKVTVALQNNPGIWGATLRISTDNGLILTKVKYERAFPFVWTTGAETYTYILDGEMDDFEDTDYNGVIATLTFAIAENATGALKVTVSPKSSSGYVVNNNMDDVIFTEGVGTIWVGASDAVIYGDVNGDGKINKKDSLDMKKYLADSEYKIDLAAADVNGDGKVNKKDALRLKQYLADWDVALGA